MDMRETFAFAVAVAASAIIPVAAVAAELHLHQRIESIDGVLLRQPDFRPETAPILPQVDAVRTVDHAVFQEPGQPAEMIFVHVSQKNRADAVEIDFFPD